MTSWSSTAMLFTRNESDYIYEGESEDERSFRWIPGKSYDEHGGGIAMKRTAMRRIATMRRIANEEGDEESDEEEAWEEDDNIIDGEDWSQYTYRDAATGRRLTPQGGKGAVLWREHQRSDHCVTRKSFQQRSSCDDVCERSSKDAKGRLELERELERLRAKSSPSRKDLKSSVRPELEVPGG